MVIEVTDKNIEETLTKTEKTLLIFSAPWCGPCRMLGPVLEQISTTNEGITIGKLSVDTEPESTVKYGITGVPAILYFKNGELIDKTMGATHKKNIQDKLDSL